MPFVPTWTSEYVEIPSHVGNKFIFRDPMLFFVPTDFYRSSIVRA